jgi:hypothetical protein
MIVSPIAFATGSGYAQAATQSTARLRVSARLLRDKAWPNWRIADE